MKPAQAEALREMQAFLTGLGVDARFDPITTMLYSTDASNHQVEPLGVVLPRRQEEAAAIVAKACQLRLPILPRGAGTSLGGQAVGACLVLDTTRHLNRILKIDVEAKTATLEPGVVCSSLNRDAAASGLMYGPDPASADRATFGGMIGNNATGAHSIRYGMSSDHVVRAKVILGDGSVADFGAVTEIEAGIRSRQSTVEAGVYRTALELHRTIGSEVQNRWPATWRRSSGYGLNYLTGYTPDAPAGWYRAPAAYVHPDRIDLPAAFCGSEGTLGVLIEADVGLVPKPRATALLLVAFDSVADACEATPSLLEAEPSAIELVPAALIERARRVPTYARKLGFLEGTPRTMLAVEFEGESPAAAIAGARGARFTGTLIGEAATQAEFWEVRKAGLGLLTSVPGDAKPITFIEDVAVPVGSLSEYVRRVERILADHGTTAEWYGHASAGCVHMRPVVNLKTEHGRRALRQIAEDVVQEVFELRGAVSGEHGDGLSHTEFNARLFGPELTQAFGRLKQAFDPAGILNPGKVVVLEDGPPPSINGDLRYRQDTGSPAELRTEFGFRREQGFLRALEACNGVGVCRKDTGVMCPSFQATREEIDSTRGRANALRAALSGWLPPESLLKPEMHRVLDLCLECKGCKAECPNAVDMARIKAEYLAWYQVEHGVPVRSRLFADIARVQAALAPVAPLHNTLRRSKLFRRALQAAVGVDARRTLPALGRRRLAGAVPDLKLVDGAAEGRVALFIDTFTDRNEADVGRAALRVLQAAGMGAGKVPGQVCCGRPMISKGLLAQARRHARQNIDVLAPFAEAGVPILGLEPSCLLTLRDEYLEFFPDDPRALAVARATRLLEELMVEREPSGEARFHRLRLRPSSGLVLVHNHCHAKALVGSAPMVELLAALGEVQETTAGCCGMAGSFGYEREHFDLSMQIGEMNLFPEVRRSIKQGGEVAAPGMSCRTQIRDGTGYVAKHPAVLLAEHLQDVQ